MPSAPSIPGSWPTAALLQGTRAAWGSLTDLGTDALLELKQLGYSDRQIAWCTRSDELAVRAHRQGLGVNAVFKTVDTCAAELPTTPYHYSSYERPVERPMPPGNSRSWHRRAGGTRIAAQGDDPGRRSQPDRPRHRVRLLLLPRLALQEEGLATVMVNSNPETVSTDYDTSDRLYFEPLTFEDVLNVIEAERPDGVIVQLAAKPC